MFKTIRDICFIDNTLHISKKSISILSLFYIISTLLAIIRIELIRKVFNIISYDYNTYDVAIVIIEMLVIFGMEMIINAVINSYKEKCKYRIQSDLNRKMIDQSLKMQTWKNNYTNTSDRYIIMAKEVKEYVERIYSIFPLLISWIIMIPIYTVYLWSISYIAVLVAIAVEVVVWIVSKRIQIELPQLNEERRKKYRNWFVFLQRTFENLFIMRSAVNKDKYCKQYDKKAIEWNDSSVQGLKKLLTIDQMQNAGGLVIDIVLLIIGLVSLLKGRMEIGAVYAMIASVQQLKSEFKKMPEMIEDIYVTQSHTNRINDFFVNNNFIKEELDKYKGENLTKGIEIRNLYFGYNKEDCIIKDFDYHFEMGKMYAITGESGTGKTTLLLLIAKMLAYSEGTISFFGQDLNKLERTSLWKHISYVSKPCFIKGDINDNLIFGKSDFDSGFVEKVKSIEEHLFQHVFENEQGDELSAGEKQRLLIYRSVCSGCEILLLDEPFSNLDRTMEDTLMNLLLEAKEKGKCVIFTTHRKDYLSKCDEVICFQREGIVC